MAFTLSMLVLELSFMNSHHVTRKTISALVSKWPITTLETLWEIFTNNVEVNFASIIVLQSLYKMAPSGKGGGGGGLGEGGSP